jgi:hypothetical protein
VLPRFLVRLAVVCLLVWAGGNGVAVGFDEAAAGEDLISTSLTSPTVKRRQALKPPAQIRDFHSSASGFRGFVPHPVALPVSRVSHTRICRTSLGAVPIRC